MLVIRTDTAGGDVMDADAMLDTYDDAQAERDIEARYVLAIAIWDEAHHRDRRGCLPEQGVRWRLFIGAVHGGFNLERAAFLRWLVDNGRMVR
jgi:hypothetical protein